MVKQNWTKPNTFSCGRRCHAMLISHRPIRFSTEYRRLRWNSTTGECLSEILEMTTCSSSFRLWLTRHQIKNATLVLRLFVAVLSYLLIVLGLLFGSLAAMGQETSPVLDAPQPTHSQTPQPTPKQPGPQHELSKNHIFWVIPNYRSDENATQFK